MLESISGEMEALPGEPPMTTDRLLRKFEVQTGHSAQIKTHDKIFAWCVCDCSGSPVTLRSSSTNAHWAVSDLLRTTYNVHRHVVIYRAHGRCENCGSLSSLDIDHIISRAKGRDDRVSNLRALGISSSLGGCGCHDLRHRIRGGI